MYVFFYDKYSNFKPLFYFAYSLKNPRLCLGHEILYIDCLEDKKHN